MGTLISSIGQLTKRIKRIIDSRILKLWGRTSTKKSIWDEEFSRGQWKYFQNTTEDLIYSYLEKYLNNGTILDLGCGSGNTGNELNLSKYESYTGVDVSEIAIQIALARTSEKCREKRNEYVCDDISTYVPVKNFDIILFRGSIYYFSKSQIKDLLERYSYYLKEGGVFIVKMYGRKKHKSVVKVIEKNYHILDRADVGNDDTILVFK